MKFPFVPRVVGWEITRRCNLRCIHCGSTAGPPRDDELNLDEALDLCDQLADLEVELLTLSGGEPFLHPHWDALAGRLDQGGVKVMMITNGYMVEEQVERLAASPIRRVGFSIDGNQQVHDQIRANPHSFTRAMGGMRALKARGFAVGVVTHVSRMNMHLLEEMYRTFLAEGVDYWQIQMAFLAGRMKERSDQISSPEDMLVVARFVEEKRREGQLRIVNGDNLGYYSGFDITDHPWKGCFAGRWLMGIEANGNIKGCLSLPDQFVEGNIRRRSLREIWEDSQTFHYNRYFSPDLLEGVCRNCPKAADCRAGCKVTAFSTTGSVYENPYCLYRVEQAAQMTSAPPQSILADSGPKDEK